jgi:hypothetical protein
MSDEQYILIRNSEFKLRNYTATTKGKQFIVKLELEGIDPHRLAYLLEQCEVFQQAKPQAQRASKTDEALP